jgi:hypothetical protein
MSKKSAKQSRRPLILTPLLQSATVDLSDTGGSGLLFRKKILPEGTISYPDPDAPGGRRRVSFDRAYHGRLISAFQSRAVECPTVQLADERNGHNMDIKRTAGVVQELDLARPEDVDGPGLYAVIRARDEEHARLLRDLPELGVSAQIKERVDRVDGQKFPAALRHVLVTADPRVVGMGPWRPVSLSSDDDGPVIDLSDADYEETNMTAPNGSTGGSFTTNDGEINLSDEEIEAALDAAAAAGDLQLSATHDDGADDDRGLVLDLAARLEERDGAVAGIQARLAASDWKADRLELSNAGVPKVLLDEAEKVLKYPGENVLSLSDEDGRNVAVDARAVIRKLLDLTKGTIDLSDEIPGSGHEPELNLSDTPESEKAFLDAWAGRAGF